MAIAKNTGQIKMLINAKNCNPGIDGSIINRPTYTSATDSHLRGAVLNKATLSFTQLMPVWVRDCKIAMV